ncbi:MAG: CDP-diacylglycerol--serine O-phosphatidyltransferase [Candidatus Neomarinimicrobiota bacterium]|nr:MAG: CDP-diacylglycerol--serine O-phosphatidyltransferase [Candidatus Neomarinimicrobiota bacterium]
MKVQRSFIPSIFTIFNLFSGFLSILEIFHGRYITGIVLIIVAAIFDGLDGKVARRLQQESEFGIEFDSLADIVSFCVAPSILINILFVSELGFIGGILSFFPLLFGGIRLARFNVQMISERMPYYIGLPVPVNAITIGSFIWFNNKLFGNYGEPKIILPMVVVLSFLMVSHIRVSPVPKISFQKRTFTITKSIFIIVAFLLMIVFPGYTIFPVFVAFIVTQLLIWMVGYEEPRLHFSIRRKGK